MGSLDAHQASFYPELSFLVEVILPIYETYHYFLVIIL